MNLSRREFLKSSLAAAAGMGALGLLGACSTNENTTSTPSPEVTGDTIAAALTMRQYTALSADAITEKTVDFVIVGARAGRPVRRRESCGKRPVRRCGREDPARPEAVQNSAWASSRSALGLRKAQGEELDLDAMYNMFTEYTHYRTDCVLMRRYFEESKETLEWIESMGVEFEEAARYFEKSYPTWHIVKSETGVIGGGQAKTMTDHLEARARELGVEFYLETPACLLETENGKVSGVCAVSTDGKQGYHFLCNAALIATGGFGNNEEWVKEQFALNLDQDFFGMRFPGHEGDGIQMAWNAGVKQSEMIEEMIFDIFQPGSTGAYTNDIKLVMQQPNLMVNQQGKRFFNEEQVQNTTYTGNSLRNQTGNTGFMILDEAIKQSYVEANHVDFTSRVWNTDDFTQFDANFKTMEESGYTAIVKADTLEELANKMGIDPQGLAATVEEYNQLCADGYDPLGKGAAYLKPITTAPFYAAQYYPSSYGTLGGIKVNSNLEVLDQNDQVITGLYSAGTDSCTVYGDSYMFLLPGNTMGYSVNTGKFVGEAVSELLKK